MANRNSNKNIDPSAIGSHSYNEQAGAQKNTEVGRHLKPLKADADTYTTDASTARALPKGVNLAIYNNDDAVGAITLGATAAEVGSALAPGVTGTEGQVGIPCAPNDWTYVATFDKNWVISTASTLLVFIIDDYTSVK